MQEPETNRSKLAPVTGFRWICRSVVAVVLVIGPALPWALAEKPPNAVEVPAQDDVAPLLRLLKDGIRQSDATLDELEVRIPELRRRVEELTKSLESIELPSPEEEPEEPPPETEPGRELKYRPPMEELTVEKQLSFVCEEDRFSFIDFGPINERLAAIRRGRQVKGATKREAFAFDLPDSDFRVEGYLEGRLLSPGAKSEVTVVRKPGSGGETWDQIQQPESRFQRVLRSHAPGGGHYLSFAVYPDSYDAFLKARSLAWDKKWGAGGDASYDVGWNPQEPGQAIELGSGPGTKN